MQANLLRICATRFIETERRVEIPREVVTEIGSPVFVIIELPLEIIKCSGDSFMRKLCLIPYTCTTAQFMLCTF